LFIGICCSLLTLFIKGVKPYGHLLGYVPEAPAIYLDINQHHNAVEIPETKLFRYSGSLNFATNRFYKKALYDALGLNKKEQKANAYTSIRGNASNEKQNNGTVVRDEEMELNAFHYLILDFSMLAHIDIAGCHVLTEIKKDMVNRDVALYLAAPSDRVYDCLVHSMALGEGPFEVFTTLHDAVEYANAARTL